MTLLTASAVMVASVLGRPGWSGKGTPDPGEQLTIPFQPSLEPAWGNRYQQVSSAQVPPPLPRPSPTPARPCPLAASGLFSGPACSQLDSAACQAALGLGWPGGPRAWIRGGRGPGPGRWKNLRPAVFSAFPTAGGSPSQNPTPSGGFDLRAFSLPFSTLNLMSLEKGGKKKPPNQKRDM